MPKNLTSLWKKYQKLAVRHGSLGSRDTEMYALKALQFAEAEGTIGHIAQTLSLLAEHYVEVNRPEAEDTARRAIELTEAAYGEDCTRLERNLINLSLALEMKDPGEADGPIALRERALKIAERNSPWDSEDLQYQMEILVQLYIFDRRFHEAEELLLRLTKIHERIFGPDSIRIAADRAIHLEILQAQGRKEELASILESMSAKGEKWAYELPVGRFDLDDIPQIPAYGNPDSIDYRKFLPAVIKYRA